MPDEIRRLPLTRRRVLEAAVGVADREGLDALTMRRLGAELGVEAMSLYKHVANKDEILDGVVELVVGEIEVPEEGSDWKEAMRTRAISAREVFGRHSWAIGLLETRRSMGPTALRYVDAILGNLRSSGFSVEHAVHTFWLLDSYVYGHVVQESGMPLTAPDELTDPTEAKLEQAANGEYRHLGEIVDHAEGAGFSFDSEFEFGLELILAALDKNSGA